MKSLYLSCSLMLLLATACQKNKPMHLEQTSFGKLANGQEAQLFTLRNANGMEVAISNFGGTIVSWTAPDKNNQYEDITLGCDSPAGYEAGVPYFGAIIGRYGNRIAHGKFSLDGNAYTLAKNNGENALHGGIKGFDKVLWEATAQDGEEPSLTLNYTSKDGEEGYPGTLKATVIYTLQKDNSLKIDYTATTDKKTVINLTNHAYFNLTGMKSDILGHELSLNATQFLPVDSTLIPTGERLAVANTVFDFTKMKAIELGINDPADEQIKRGGGYDHCWILADSVRKELALAATVHEPISGRVMEVFTTEPGIQFYSGNFLDGSIKGKKGTVYSKRFGLCLETQHFPDSPNRSDFPSTILNPGETYRTTTVYKFSVK